jgi:hypothetical protein
LQFIKIFHFRSRVTLDGPLTAYRYLQPRSLSTPSAVWGFSTATPQQALLFRFSNPQYYHDIETARQGYLRSYPVGKSDRASGVR